MSGHALPLHLHLLGPPEVRLGEDLLDCPLVLLHLFHCFLFHKQSLVDIFTTISFDAINSQ